MTPAICVSPLVCCVERKGRGTEWDPQVTQDVACTHPAPTHHNTLATNITKNSLSSTVAGGHPLSPDKPNTLISEETKEEEDYKSPGEGGGHGDGRGISDISKACLKKHLKFTALYEECDIIEFPNYVHSIPAGLEGLRRRLVDAGGLSLGKPTTCSLARTYAKQNVRRAYFDFEEKN